MNNSKPVFEIDPNLEIDQDGDDLKFQDFSKQTSTSASSTGQNPPPLPPYTTIPIPAAAQSSSQSPQKSEPEGANKPFWTLDHYKQYFNVDTNMVVQRMLTGVLPVRKYLDVVDGNPDLYGPFWITATVVFSIFFGNTIASSLKAGVSIYDFTRLTAATSTFYAFTFLIPLILYGIIRYFHINAGYIQLVGLFGYGLTIWIPVSILAAIPSTAILWILCLIGFGVSAMFSVRNFTPIFRAPYTSDQVHRGEQPFVVSTSVRLTTGTVLLILVLAVQLGIACSFLFYFLRPLEPASNIPI